MRVGRVDKQRRLLGLAVSKPYAGDGTVLSALLGATRATALEQIAARPGVSTGALARRLNIAAPTTSQHASVLRGNDLLTTDRHRNTVHRITALGLRLLRA